MLSIGRGSRWLSPHSVTDVALGGTWESPWTALPISAIGAAGADDAVAGGRSPVPESLPSQVTVPPSPSGSQAATEKDGQRVVLGLESVFLRSLPKIRQIRRGFRVSTVGCLRLTLKVNPTIERDHIDPGSRGGNNTSENERDSCRTCNREKGARNPDEWRGK